MRKEKSRVLTLLALTLFCLVLNLKVGAFVFGILTLIKGGKYLQDPERKLKDRIQEDARTWEVRIPNSYLVQEKLFRVYKRIARKERQEPVFISSFAEIIDGFWQEASTFETQKDWMESLSYLDRHIPKTSFNRENLNEALSELQNLNLHLEKATVEVRKA